MREDINSGHGHKRGCMPEPYSREDVMQAVCAALLLGEDIGIAALDLMEESIKSGAKLSNPTTLHPGAGMSVTLSPLAAHLLSTAYHDLPIRGIGIAHEGGRTEYDLRTP